MQPRKSSWFGRGNTRAAIITASLLAIVVTPFAIAQGPTGSAAVGEGDPIEGGVRNPSPNPAQDLTRETEIIANTGTYGTRQSNKSNNGGGAIYGCRSAAGGTPANNEPCIRSNNLETGLAFEFNAQKGPVVGTITATSPNAKPFTTNATGVADGLNADRVDGLQGADIAAGVAAANTNATNSRTRWALVNSAGEIEAQSGGFSITSCYPTTPAPANGNCYINANDDLTNNGLTATIALQNQINQGGGTMNGTDSTPPNDGDNLEFSGEISTARCATANLVACAPEGTNNANHLVVSPRNSDGSRTTSETRKRFYVTVTGQ